MKHSSAPVRSAGIPDGRYSIVIEDNTFSYASAEAHKAQKSGRANIQVFYYEGDPYPWKVLQWADDEQTPWDNRVLTIKNNQVVSVQVRA